MKTTDRVAIVGTGYSTVGRKTGLSWEQLAIQAAKAALDDAGLRPQDIDGVTTVGGEALAIGQMMGMMPLGFFSTCGVGPAFSAAALEAISAIRAGMCDTVIALRIMMQQPTSAELTGGSASLQGFGDWANYLWPFGVFSPVQWAGLLTQRYMQEFGATEEMFGTQIVTQRRYAELNEDAIQRKPLSLDDYLAARYVSKPVRLLDCDYPCDAGSAVIFTTEERARDLAQKPVFVDSYAMSAIADLNFEILPDMVTTSPQHCADQLWARTDLTPADVDCAQLYDGFTIITFQWLEALGFCEKGGAGQFVLDGGTGPGGRLPTNTDGGACNVGRRHGANFCIEATRQLRGTCGERQAPGADVSVWSNAVGPFSAAFLLSSS